MRNLIVIATVTAVLAVLLAPLAQADPARHMHDYFATVSAVPHDIRDHTEIKQLTAGSATFPRPSSSSFSWNDAGIGAATSTGILLLLGTTVVFATKRRRRLAL